MKLFLQKNAKFSSAGAPPPGPHCEFLATRLADFVVVQHIIYPLVTGSASDANDWMIRTLFIAMTTSYLEEFAPAWEFPVILWISSNSCPLNLHLVRSHQAEIIIVKRLNQGRNNVTRFRLNPNHSIRVVVETTPLQ